MKYKNIKEKLLKDLSRTGWDRILEPFILSEEFDEILVTLKNENITPKSKNIFRAFKECNYNDLKVVMIGQDAYPTEGDADGLCFSARYSKNEPASLRIIFNEIQETVYNNGEYSRDKDLTRWAKQGILMINTGMTTRVGEIGVHVKLWKPFIDFLLKRLNELNTGLIYLTIGGVAKKVIKHINIDNNYILHVYHPASACYNGGVWDSGDIFNTINQILKKNKNEEIKW